jgi:hypothetical protein
LQIILKNYKIIGTHKAIHYNPIGRNKGFIIFIIIIIIKILLLLLFLLLLLLLLSSSLLSLLIIILINKLINKLNEAKLNQHILFKIEYNLSTQVILKALILILKIKIIKKGTRLINTWISKASATQRAGRTG